MIDIIYVFLKNWGKEVGENGRNIILAIDELEVSQNLTQCFNRDEYKLKEKDIFTGFWRYVEYYKFRIALCYITVNDITNSSKSNKIKLA